MMGITTLLIMLKQRRSGAQIKRMRKQIETLIDYGKETEKGQAEETFEAVNTDRNNESA